MGRSASGLPDFDDPAGWKIDVVQDGTVGYVRFPALDGQLPAGKTWIRGDADGASTSGFDFGELEQFAKSDPRDVLGALRAVTSEVETVGSEQLRGVETTHYRATVDPARAREARERQGSDRRRSRSSISSAPRRASARSRSTCGSTRRGSFASSRCRSRPRSRARRGRARCRCRSSSGTTARPSTSSSRPRLRSSTHPPSAASQPARKGLARHSGHGADAFRDLARPGSARADPGLAPEWARCECPRRARRGDDPAP